MNDRELLKLAAKAAGIEIDWQYPVDSTMRLLNPDPDMPEICYSPRTIDESGFAISWNPLTDDGDALRLAVDLGLRINTCVSSDYIEDQPSAEVEGLLFVNGLPMRVNVKGVYSGNPRAANRRAIVRAAAEIGKTRGV